MKFANIASGEAVFVDANTFIYAFAPDPQFGPPSDQLLQRIEQNELHGRTSTGVLSDVAHRLMTLEACAMFGWPYAGIAQRLKRSPMQVRQLSRYRQAVDEIIAMGFHIFPALADHVSAATQLSLAHGLLSNDALIVVLMQEHGLVHIASHDADFDRVPGINRYAPI
ncbi:MAG: type II toxin-antitoxin system VapC family toxin [Planctomycetaceae bacterium]